jgi:hypothetical protein
MDNVYYYTLDLTIKYEPTPIDVTRVLPAFAQNVISVAIMLAIGLKYEEIILIGCDHTWWGYNNEDIMNGVWAPHYYAESKKEIGYNKTSWSKLGFENMQKTINTQKREYSILRAIAEQSGIQIYNATAGGYLESFSRIRFESLFV